MLVVLHDVCDVWSVHLKKGVTTSFSWQKIVVETTDVITIGAKTASRLDATLSVMEIT